MLPVSLLLSLPAIVSSLKRIVSKHLVNYIILYPLRSRGHIPRHICIVMDGNRRWARKRHLQSNSEGHIFGYFTMEDMLEKLKFLGVKYVSVFAYSLENRKRPEDEKKFLMKLAQDKCIRMKQHIVNGMNFRMKVCGRLWEFKNERLRNEFLHVMLESELRGGNDVCETHSEYYPHWYTTRVSTPDTSCILYGKRLQRDEDVALREERLRFNLCFAYTGTDDMNHAAFQLIVRGLRAGLLRASDITPLLFQRSMHTDHCPSPDLLIRTSGETRLSDFMNWQLGGTYLKFINVMWPDFSVWHLMKIIIEFQHNYPEYCKRQQLVMESVQKCERSANLNDGREERIGEYLQSIDQASYLHLPLLLNKEQSSEDQ